MSGVECPSHFVVRGELIMSVSVSGRRENVVYAFVCVYMCVIEKGRPRGRGAACFLFFRAKKRAKIESKNNLLTMRGVV